MVKIGSVELNKAVCCNNLRLSESATDGWEKTTPDPFGMKEADVIIKPSNRRGD